MADDRDAMMREIDSELRREQFEKLWDRYGVYVILAVVSIIAGVGGYKWWEARSIANAQAAGARYEAASRLAEDGKSAEAHEAFAAIVKDSPAGYATLARFRLAADAVQAGKADEAQTIYDALASDSSVDGLLRQYAQLQSAALKVDTADFTEMQNRLTPLLGAGNAWRFSARELLGLSAYRAGRLDDARQVLLELAADDKTPPSMRERVNFMMGLITAAEAARSSEAAQPASGGTPAEAPPKVQ